MKSNPTPSCSHSRLTFTPSQHASVAGYKHPTLNQRLSAALPQVSVKSATKASQEEEGSSTFPAPLVLPGDELSLDPTSPQQSLRSWIRGKHRNEVVSKRRTIYLATPPSAEPGLEYVKDWTKPRGMKESDVSFPKIEDLKRYLEAFYYGLEVKMLPESKLRFLASVEDVEPAPIKKGKKTTAPENKSPILWLNTKASPSSSKGESELIGIRTRSTPKGLFTHQLNLSDLLDAAIEMLPDDAYALLVLVEHDIFEDEEDEFVCGRAFGGSRVAVVSSARYNPLLDELQGLEEATHHGWPGSHCAEYVDRCCGETKAKATKGRKRKIDDENDGLIKGLSITEQLELETKSPMHAAFLQHVSPQPLSLSGLWLSRICKTGSHELGHCFGIAHCVYYACIMQGTSSLAEDARQPPYLCPVDLAKVLRATGADERERYQALLQFCETFKVDGGLFATYGPWISGRLREIQSEEKQ